MPSTYINQLVVIDTVTHLTYVGLLTKVSETSLCMQEVAIIDEGIIKIPLEQYLIECATHGSCPSRKSVWVERSKIISLSRLDDIIIPD